MATYIYTSEKRSPQSTMAPTGRRRLADALFAIGAGSVLTAGVATAATDLMPISPDAALFALRAELDAAVAATSYDETGLEQSDEQITLASERLIDACWAIIDAPRAQTPAGWAPKAAAAMHQLRFSCVCGARVSDGEEMAWDLLSELAGNIYVAPLMPECLQILEELGRA